MRGGGGQGGESGTGAGAGAGAGAGRGRRRWRGQGARMQPYSAAGAEKMDLFKRHKSSSECLFKRQKS